MARARAIMLGALLLALAASGCGGSALSPAYVRAANQALAAQNGSADTTGTSTGTAPASNPTATQPVATGPLRGVTHGSSNPVAGSPQSGAGLPAGGSPAVPRSTGGAGGAHAASCAGFHNQTGITNSTITIANVADLSGPVPGIFTSAQQAVKAYVAYFNATSSLCGRKLSLLSLDSRTDPGADQQAYTTACQHSFAAVGSMSAFDSGGAATAQACGIPDIRSQSVSDARNACTTCFGAQATQLHVFQNAVPDFFVRHYHAASQHAAMIYVNAAASVENAKVQQSVEEKRGMHFGAGDSMSFSVSEFNYAPYAQKMKQDGVRWVQFVGSPDEAVRLAQAMQAAQFHPDVFLLDPTAYNPTFVQSGGSAVDGAIVFINFTPFEEAAGNPEMRLYEAWLQQVAPGAAPTYFGLFSWSAARLFGERAAALGGRLTRASLVASIRTVSGWTDHGLHSPQAVGPKLNGNCWRFLQLHNGVWRPLGGTHYLCDGSTQGG